MTWNQIVTIIYDYTAPGLPPSEWQDDAPVVTFDCRGRFWLRGHGLDHCHGSNRLQGGGNALGQPSPAFFLFLANRSSTLSFLVSQTTLTCISGWVFNCPPCERWGTPQLWFLAVLTWRIGLTSCRVVDVAKTKCSLKDFITQHPSSTPPPSSLFLKGTKGF